ncbi:MAG: phage tail tube protein [Alphaproteobacteria bacterium]|nr:phage tail tube protein [Alphaproteobacteria bacterium]
MSAVDANTIQLAVARQTALGVRASAGVRQLEPNSDPAPTFAPDITKIARTPISRRLSRRKGTPTALAANVSFGEDITYSSLPYWLEAALYSTWRNGQERLMDPDSVAAGFTFPNNSFNAGAMARLTAKLPPNRGLLWAEGFTSARNNGLKLRAGAVTANTIPATDADAASTALVAEPAPADARISLAGFRLAGAGQQTWAWDEDSRLATLTGAANAVSNGMGLGEGLVNDGQAANRNKPLSVGQTVHIGSILADGGALGRGLRIEGNGGSAGVTGFARLVRFEENSLIFDRVDTALQMNFALPSTPANVIDILFGDFLTDEAIDDDYYARHLHTLELVSPDLEGEDAATADDGYEYAEDQVVATLGLNFPLEDKATMTVNLVGTDISPPSTVRSAGFDSQAEPLHTEAYNTASDFARLRLTDENDELLTEDFTAVTINVNPQSGTESVLGQLGPRFLNRGILQCDIDATVIFADDGIPRAIRDNETTRFDLISRNNDGVFVLDLPSQTLGGGGREYPTNQKVTLSTTGESFEDETFGRSLMCSLIPAPIPIT